MKIPLHLKTIYDLGGGVIYENNNEKWIKSSIFNNQEQNIIDHLKNNPEEYKNVIDDLYSSTVLIYRNNGDLLEPVRNDAFIYSINNFLDVKYKSLSQFQGLQMYYNPLPTCIIGMNASPQPKYGLIEPDRNIAAINDGFVIIPRLKITIDDDHIYYCSDIYDSIAIDQHLREGVEYKFNLQGNVYFNRRNQNDN